MNIRSTFRLCVLFIGMIFISSLSAQEDKKTIEKHAEIQAYEAKKMFNLNEEDTKLVWRAIFSRNLAYSQIHSGDKSIKSETKQLKVKIDTSFKNKLSNVLSEKEIETLTSWIIKNSKK